MSGKVVSWLTVFYVIILFPMSYLKLRSFICIVRPSDTSCPSRRCRRRPLSVVVRPLSVRPVVSRRRRPRSLSVRPSRRPSCRRRPFSVRPSSSSVLCPSVVVVRPVRPAVRLISTYMTSTLYFVFCIFQFSRQVVTLPALGESCDVCFEELGYQRTFSASSSHSLKMNSKTMQHRCSKHQCPTVQRSEKGKHN